MAIDTLESLHRHLQTALQIEHATIPTYLTALYSLKDGRNPEAFEVIQSVVMEEMLHMVLVANVFNAVGGTPRLAYPGFVPDYPGALPHSAGTFTVGLLKFSKPALETFVRIEKPAPAGAPPEDEGWETIGQFYAAIMEALPRLDRDLGGIFTGDPSRQIQPHHFYYGGGGESVVVHREGEGPHPAHAHRGGLEIVSIDPADARDPHRKCSRNCEGECGPLCDALDALDEVVEQGEGLPGQISDGDHLHFEQEEEVAHYFRFNEILQGRYYTREDTPASGPTGPEFPVDWEGVWNMAPNPRMARYEDQPEIHDLMVHFNRRYTELLRTLERAFNGEPEALMPAVPMMYELRNRAQALMKIPTGDGSTTAGPSFEFIE